MINHTGTGHITFATTRIKRAIKFYENVLNFKVTHQLSDPAWCEMESGEMEIGLAEVQTVKPGQTSLTLIVDDIDAAIAGLKSNKIEHSAVSEVPGLARLVTFDDPDGNPLMFRQNL